MDPYRVTGVIQRFPGANGWFYLELPAELGLLFRPLVGQRWPALIKVRCTVGQTSWDGSILPIKGGPLFIALPAPVRKKEALAEGSAITLTFGLPS